MPTRHEPGTGRADRLIRSATLLAIGALGELASAQTADPLLRLVNLTPPPQYIIQGKPELSTLYIDGSQITIDTYEVWRFICGSDTTGLTADDLQAIAQAHYDEFKNGPAVVIDRGLRGGTIDVILNAGSSVPSDALPALAAAEAYLETQFSDAITVKLSISFSNLGAGVLGATSSAFVNNVPWTTSRDGLIAGIDADDTIQTFLPSSTLPIRYDAGTSTITNETVVDWTKSAYRATVGTTSGNAGSTAFNSNFTWDYDPSNGVGGYSFIDVAIHETGHALGFVSAVDFVNPTEPQTLDLYRFNRTDGSGDYNPDTTAEFTTTPRLLDYNNPNDDHQFDIISAEHRLEDGTPYQASHWRQASNVGLMDPAIASGQTRYPDYFSSADLTAFDSIGYDYPPCVAGDVLLQPQSEDACFGETVVLSTATNASSPTYQWRKNFVNLTDGGDVSGATTATLTIANVDPDDAGDYDCVIRNGVTGCSAFTDVATVTVGLCSGITTLVRNNTTPTSGVDLASFERNSTHFTFDLRVDTTLIPSDWTASEFSVDVLEIAEGKIWHATDQTDFGPPAYNLAVPFLADTSTDTRAFDTFVCPPASPFFTLATLAAPGGVISTDVKIRGISGQGNEIPLAWFDTTSNPAGDNFVAARLTFEIFTPGSLTTTPGGTLFATITGRSSSAAFPAGENFSFSLYRTTDADPCPEDLDNDGSIDLNDLSILLVHFGAAGTPEQGDINGDGVVDLVDLSALLVVFGTNCP